MSAAYIWLYAFCALLLNVVEDLSASFFLSLAKGEQRLCLWLVRLLLLSHHSSPRILSERLIQISQASGFLPACWICFQATLLSTSSPAQCKPRDEESCSNVFNIPDSHNLLPQDLWAYNSHKKERHLFKCFPDIFGSLSQKKKKNVHHFYQAYMRVNFLVVSMVSALKG